LRAGSSPATTATSTRAKINTDQKTLEKFIITVATNHLSIIEISNWLKINTEN